MNKIDFEHAGLEFVAGDKFSSGIGLPTIVEEFAWRTNTGVKPEFDGVVELGFKDGSVELNRMPCQFAWDLNRDIPRHEISRWRPHLTKVEDKPKSPYDVDAHVSEAKPILAQAAQEVGDTLMYTLNESGGAPWYKCEILDIGVAGFTIHSPHLEEDYDIGVQFIKHGGIVFKPIQTEREAAIEDVTGEWPMADVSTIEVMHDMGYRLQTPKNNVT